jgi:hypothetical protein
MRHRFHSYGMTVLPLNVAHAMNSSGAIAGATGRNAAIDRDGGVMVLQGMAGYTALAGNGHI